MPIFQRIPWKLTICNRVQRTHTGIDYVFYVRATQPPQIDGGFNDDHDNDGDGDGDGGD